MAFVKGFKKTAEGLGDAISASIKKVVGPNVAPPKPPTPGSNMGKAFGSIRSAFGG